MTDNQYVFVVGLPRTGSTLLRTLLNRSDCVSIAPETHFLHHYARIGKKKRLLRFGNLNEAKSVDRFLDDLFTPRRAAGKDFWAWLNHNTTRSQFRDLLLATDRSDRAIFKLFIQLYTEWKKGEVQPGMILGEKTAANIYYVPELIRWFPNARIIHTFRDPRGIFVSALKLVNDGKWGVKARLPSALPRTIVSPSLEAIMAVYILRIWLDAVRLHARYVQAYPEQYQLVRFEDLLQAPEQHLRQICAFIQAPFDSSMVEEVSSVGSSFSDQRIIRGAGFEQSAADRWKDRIHPLPQAWLTTWTGRQLDQFGYGR
ncbi:MAG TPA: sulfotransferase [Anaerolineaceae bacterium]|nr:sulfotransferase [Anaerolineaceae bacterium]